MGFTDLVTRITGYKVNQTNWNALINNWDFVATAAGLLKHEVGGIELDISAIAKGSVISATATGVTALLGVGSNGAILEAASGEATGLKWGTGFKFATGTYSGDGATSQAITGVGFQVKYLIITERETADSQAMTVIWTSDTIIDDNADGMAVVITTAALSKINTIIALGADGFTVDDAAVDDHPNKNGITYNYIAFG